MCGAFVLQSFSTMLNGDAMPAVAGVICAFSVSWHQTWTVQTAAGIKGTARGE
jgi:hypothetical protein